MLYATDSSLHFVALMVTDVLMYAGEKKLLNSAVYFLLSFSENLQKLLILAYEQLDTPAGRDLCYSCMEFPFFKPLWPMLLAVLR